MKISLYQTFLDREKRLPYLKVQQSYMYENQDCSSSDRIWRLLQETVGLGRLAEEHLYVICMDTKCRIKALFEASHGSTTMSIIAVAEIMRMVLLSGGTAFALSHNHPSGDATPSQEDIESTRRIREAAALLGFEFVDHIICCDTTYYSFREQMPELWE